MFQYMTLVSDFPIMALEEMLPAKTGYRSHSIKAAG